MSNTADSFSPEFRDWLQNGLGEALGEDASSPPGLGSEQFEQKLQRLADAEHYHPIDRPGERYGIDVEFISNFITPEMQPAFRALAREFLQKEPLLAEPESRSWLTRIVYPYRKERAFTDAYEFRVLGMMLLCAEHGSEYSKEILLSLYKTFYKKEYNVLKRMKSLPLHEAVTAFCDEGMFESDDNPEELARVFVIADLMGIELDGMWNRLIQIYNDGFFREYLMWEMIHIAAGDDRIQGRNFEQELEAKEYLTELFPDIGWIDFDDMDAEDGRFFILEDVKHLIESTFDENGAGTEALFGDRYFRLLANAAKAVSGYADELGEEDLERVILLAVIRYLAAAIARLITIRNTELNELLNIEFHDLVDPGTIEKLTKQKLNPAELAVIRTTMQAGSLELQAKDERSGKLIRRLDSIRGKGGSRDAQEGQTAAEPKTPGDWDGKDEQIRVLQEQLNEARRQLKLAQSNLDHQHSLYEEQKESAETLQRQVEESRKDRGELLALRHFVHQMDTGDVPEDEIPDTAKIEELKKHKIAIIGGHENWTKKMKRILPEWTYIGAREGLSADSAVTSVEKVYFYTDIIGHSMYNKFMKSAQEKKRPFGFMHGTNISSIVNAVFEDL